ncbi:MAG: hypothetical protein E3J54_02060, partial [Actinobacteria bacterium]
MQTKKARNIALLIVVLFVLVEGLFFVRAFPKYQIPDEELYVRNVLLYDGGKIPYFGVESETGHPTLYELVIYPFYKILDFNIFYRFARTLSLLFFAGALLLTYFMIENLFPDMKNLSLFTITALAFSPQLVFLFSSVNSDSFLMFLFSAAIFLLVRIHLKKAKLLDYILLIVTLIAGFLTKERFLIITPPLIYVLAARIMTNYKNRAIKESRGAGRAVVNASAILVLFFFVNILIFRYLKQEIDMFFYATNFSLEGVFRIFKQFFWGYFGLLQYPWPVWVYTIAAIFTILAIVGVVYYFREKASSSAKAWLSIFAIVSVMMFAFVFFY